MSLTRVITIGLQTLMNVNPILVKMVVRATTECLTSTVNADRDTRERRVVTVRVVDVVGFKIYMFPIGN